MIKEQLITVQRLRESCSTAAAETKASAKCNAEYLEEFPYPVSFSVSRYVQVSEGINELTFRKHDMYENFCPSHSTP
jgi:hypothetical protein